MIDGALWLSLQHSTPPVSIWDSTHLRGQQSVLEEPGMGGTRKRLGCSTHASPGRGGVDPPRHGHGSGGSTHCRGALGREESPPCSKLPGVRPTGIRKPGTDQCPAYDSAASLARAGCRCQLPSIYSSGAPASIHRRIMTSSSPLNWPAWSPTTCTATIVPASGSGGLMPTRTPS